MSRHTMMEIHLMEKERKPQNMFNWALHSPLQEAVANRVGTQTGYGGRAIGKFAQLLDGALPVTLQ